jgi:hypothetical protein
MGCINSVIYPWGRGKILVKMTEGLVDSVFLSVGKTHSRMKNAISGERLRLYNQGWYRNSEQNTSKLKIFPGLPNVEI